MAMYEVSVLIDGWVQVRIEAGNRQEALTNLRTARPHIDLFSPEQKVVGEVIGPGMFCIEAEDISVYREDTVDTYHAPVSKP